MKEQRKKGKGKFLDLLQMVFYVSIIVLFVVVTVGLIVVEIYVWVTYGNKPIDEVPIWVLWFMFGGKNG